MTFASVKLFTTKVDIVAFALSDSTKTLPYTHTAFCTFVLIFIFTHTLDLYSFTCRQFNERLRCCGSYSFDVFCAPQSFYLIKTTNCWKNHAYETHTHTHLPAAIMHVCLKQQPIISKCNYIAKYYIVPAKVAFFYCSFSPLSTPPPCQQFRVYSLPVWQMSYHNLSLTRATPSKFILIKVYISLKFVADFCIKSPKKKL